MSNCWHQSITRYHFRSFNQSHDEQKSLPMNLPRSLENQSPQLAIFPPLGYSVFRDLNNRLPNTILFYATFTTSKTSMFVTVQI